LGFSSVRCGYCNTFLGLPKRCPTCNNGGIPTREKFGRQVREDSLWNNRPQFAEVFGG